MLISSQELGSEVLRDNCFSLSLPFSVDFFIAFYSDLSTISATSTPPVALFDKCIYGIGFIAGRKDKNEWGCPSTSNSLNVDAPDI